MLNLAFENELSHSAPPTVQAKCVQSVGLLSQVSDTMQAPLSCELCLGALNQWDILRDCFPIGKSHVIC